MKQPIQLLFMIVLLLCSGYVLTNKHFLFSKVMTNYYTKNDTFTTVTNEQMTIHVKEEQTALAQQLIVLRESVHTVLAQVLPSERLSSLSILVVDEGDDAYERYLADDTIGVYFPMLNTMMLDSSENVNVQHTFVHEYAHYLVDQQLEQLVIDEQSLPAWFHEGIANYAEYRVFHELPFTYSRFHATPFSQLEEQTADNAHTVYHQGFYAIADLVHVYGDAIIMRIIEEINTTREFTNGFTRATNIHIETYHERFMYDAAEMNALYGLVPYEAATVEQRLQQRAKQYARVNPASQDELLLYVMLAIENRDDEQIEAALQDYAFLFQKPDLYLQVAHLLMPYDEHLAKRLLEQGKLYTEETSIVYEAKVAALYELYE